MRFNPKRSARQSKPWTAERTRRAVNVTFPQLEGQPETVNCLDVRNDHRMMVSENAVYGAVYNSFSPLYGRAQSEVMRELLNEGTILSNSKGIFWTAAYWSKRRSVRRAA